MTPAQGSGSGAASVTKSAAARPGSSPLFDLSSIDGARRVVTRTELERYIPHRGPMALLDGIVWHSADFTRAVGIKHVRPDEFWVAGHFPSRPLLPGVLMIEAGAQLACFAFNARRPKTEVIAFLRIKDAAFRGMVQPGDDLYLLVNEIKFGRRQFESEIQGIVGGLAGRIAFDARITGMSMNA